MSANPVMQAAFTAVYGSPPGSGQRLAELYDDFRRKRRRFMRITDDAKSMRALKSAERAFDAVSDALIAAADCGWDKAFAVQLPDGRILINAIDEQQGSIGDQWCFLQCVKPGRFVKLP
jgi:hypothetical protein